jgi:hypothetical protein
MGMRPPTIGKAEATNPVTRRKSKKAAAMRLPRVNLKHEKSALSLVFKIFSVQAVCF